MRSWSFNKKLLMIGFLFVATVCAMTAVSVFGLVRVDKSLEQYHSTLEASWLFDEVSQGYEKIRSIEASAILEPTIEQTAIYPKKIADAYRDWEKGIDNLNAKLSDGTPKNQLNDLKFQINQRKELSEKILKASIEGDTELAVSFYIQETPVKSVDEKILTLHQPDHFASVNLGLVGSDASMSRDLLALAALKRVDFFNHRWNVHLPSDPMRIHLAG